MPSVSGVRAAMMSSSSSKASDGGVQQPELAGQRFLPVGRRATRGSLSLGLVP
jgi:hypothetical protein